METKLTTKQKEFLLDTFFKIEKYPGSISIATKLLDTGECIVAGYARIWIGGIGNFINTEIAENAVGCSLYTFDLSYFLSSEWFQSVQNDYLNILTNKIKDIQSEYEDINCL